jgi:hypothetical protein
MRRVPAAAPVSTQRPLPWTALVEALGESSFDAMRSALAKAGIDPFDRDAFLLDGAVGRVLRDFVPADAPAEAVTEYGALLHALYLHREHGSSVRVLERDAATALLAAPPESAATAEAPHAVYVRLPERLVWAASAPGAPHEPIDGLFVLRSPGRWRVLAVLGFRPDRHGFTVVTADAASPPRPARRSDGSPPFATVLPAGERMGFFSVTTPPELVLLALLALSAARG